MPDAHHGYGLPIGGVLATDNAVIPYAVGVDIGCRMALSVYDLPAKYLTQRTQEVRHLLLENTRFGCGRAWERGQRLDHAVLHNDTFRTVPFLKNKLDRAAEQVGTSGSGNHFVEFGLVEITEATAELGLPPASTWAYSRTRARGAGREHRRALHHSSPRACAGCPPRRSTWPGWASTLKPARNTGPP
ncbi:MAG: RtcB family protein [Hymenobacter sp.]